MCFNYYCYGVSASEVEIDCLTGDHVVLRTDIVMDVGNSLNPAIDIGQVSFGDHTMNSWRIKSFMVDMVDLCACKYCWKCRTGQFPYEFIMSSCKR